MSRLANALDDTRKERSENRINERFMMITYGIVSSKHYLENLDIIIELPSEGIRGDDELIATQINFEEMRNADIATVLVVVTMTT